MMNLWIKVAQLTFFHVGLGTFCRPCPEMDGSVNINFFLLNFRSSGKNCEDLLRIHGAMVRSGNKLDGVVVTV